ncbi:MAG TPA: hypothetical protein DDX51_06400 [Clostridiales bacterium]|nr:hypothetical protein [Clostridiales bacterium]
MILFVDINDVCRAPAAARIYRSLHQKPAHSAGVYADEGAALGAGICPELLSGHTARVLSGSVLDKADEVWCVTGAIARHLAQEHPRQAHKIHAMRDVDDPFGGGRTAYEHCIRQIRAQVEEME